MQAKELAEKYLIFKCLAGSHSYGTNIESSDVDTRGLFIAPPENILSCIQSIEQVCDDKNDETIFELRKFMKLAAECNPNIIELLATDECNIQFISWPMIELRKNLHLFISKKARHSFSGYAVSQLHRIRGHHKWIQRPKPVEPPQLVDYSYFIDTADGNIIRDKDSLLKLSQQTFLAATVGEYLYRVFESPEFFKEKLGFFTEDGTQLRYVDVEDSVLSERATYRGNFIVRQQDFKRDHKEWKSYWEWKAKRNVARAELEEKFGFDCKHALHLVRLYKMGHEILSEGKVVVRRPDAQELLDIRNGKFNYEELLAWAADADKKLDALYETSSLPYGADYVKIDELYRSIVLRYWKEHDLLHV